MSNNQDNDIEDLKKQGTSKEKETSKVFKKSSPNGKITAYLGKRDFIDYLDYIDPVDGVVLIDPEYIKERKVFVHVLAAFRYGREDLDVLGLTFRKDLYLTSHQVFPQVAPGTSSAKPDFNAQSTSSVNSDAANPATNTNTNNNSTNNISNNNIIQSEPGTVVNNGRKLTRLQERLIKKLGQNAFPFYFELPHNSPASVTLQPGPNDSGKPCGVDYELKAYVADNPDEKAHKRNSVKLAIRKLTYAPEKESPQPSAEVVKDFIMSPGSLRLEASLDKEKYYHGESISVNVLVDNNSNKTIKKIKIAVRQYAEICLYSTTSYKCMIEELEFEDGFPISPSQTGWCKVYKVCPLLNNNRDKRGLALDGKLKHEDTNLASSTLINENTNKENLGIIVSYKVKVRLVLGFGTSDVYVELPFTMSHPKPSEEELSMSNFTFEELHVKTSTTNNKSDENRISNTMGQKTNSTNDKINPVSSHQNNNNNISNSSAIIDPDLIQLDTNWDEEDIPTQNHNNNSNNPQQNQLEKNGIIHQSADDDLIFEDFARLRLTGGDL